MAPWEERASPHSWSEVGGPQLVPQGCSVAKVIWPTWCSEYVKISCQYFKIRGVRIRDPENWVCMKESDDWAAWVSGLCPSAAELWVSTQAGLPLWGLRVPTWPPDPFQGLPGCSGHLSWHPVGVLSSCGSLSCCNTESDSTGLGTGPCPALKEFPRDAEAASPSTEATLSSKAVEELRPV